MVLYIVIVVLSIAGSFIGFYLSAITNNIIHIENGRKPNAGVSIFPTIPVLQILYVLIAWGLNRLHPGMGYLIVIGFIFTTSVYCLYQIKVKSALFNKLLINDKTSSS